MHLQGSEVEMQFSPLSELPLGLSRDDIARVMAPFVSRRVETGDAEWDAMLRRRKKRILRNNLRRVALGWLPQHQRRDAAVVDEYTRVWRTGYGAYDPAHPPGRYSPLALG